MKKAVIVIMVMIRIMVTNIQVCWNQAGGDLQKAAQLIITRAELGEELRPSQVGSNFFLSTLKK